MLALKRRMPPHRTVLVWARKRLQPRQQQRPRVRLQTQARKLLLQPASQQRLQATLQLILSIKAILKKRLEPPAKQRRSLPLTQSIGGMRTKSTKSFMLNWIDGKRQLEMQLVRLERHPGQQVTPLPPPTRLQRKRDRQQTERLRRRRVLGKRGSGGRKPPGKLARPLGKLVKRHVTTVAVRMA